MRGYTVYVRISSIFYSISDSMAGSSWTAYSTSYDHLPIPTLSKLEIRPECFIPSEIGHGTTELILTIYQYLWIDNYIYVLEMCINHNYMKFEVNDPPSHILIDRFL